MTGKEKVDNKNIEIKKEIVKEKTQRFLKDPFNLALIGVMLYATIIRIYFFNIAKNQAHWWDTLAFGSIAKEMVYHLWSNSAFLQNEFVIRPPFLSLMWSVFIRLNFSEIFTLFCLEIIPSILSVLFLFLLTKELYGKRVALIASLIFASLWIHLFYSVRIMSDVPALCFAIASMYFFVKSYEHFNIKYFSVSILLISLSILSRYFFGIIGAIFLIMVIVKHKQKFIFNKKFWIGGLLGAIPLIIFFAYNLITYASILPASSVYTASALEKPTFAYYVLGFINYDLQLVITLFFVFGLTLVLLELFLGYDSINKIQKLRSHLILTLILLFSLVFFIFILRAAEDRYLLLCLPSLIIFSSIGLDFIYGLIRKYNKEASIAFVILILLFASYSHFKYADSIISSKKATYSQMKDAFIWINENTPLNSVIAGDGITLYSIYYAQRPIMEFNLTNSSDSIYLADYIVLHGFEYQSQELISFVNSKQSSFIPVYASFFDTAQTQPAVVVYQVNKTSM